MLHSGSETLFLAFLLAANAGGLFAILEFLLEKSKEEERKKAASEEDENDELFDSMLNQTSKDHGDYSSNRFLEFVLGWVRKTLEGKLLLLLGFYDTFYINSLYITFRN